MPLTTNNLKFTIKQKTLNVLAFLLAVTVGSAQEIIEENTPQTVKDSVVKTGALKVDGVAAVVGDYIILDSDIDKTLLQLKAQGASTANFDRCQLFGKLLEDKLYAHQAIQDSIEVNDAEIRSRVDQQINQFLQQTNGSMDELLEFYKKDDEVSFREEMFEINKSNMLAAKMQDKVIEEVEVTPEEVRQFFNNIPKEERPRFGTELKVAQIVIEPKVSEEENQRVIDQLKEYKRQVEEEGRSFTSRAVLYTEDGASKKNGGLYTLNRSKPRMVKEFREVAFSLQEGEISEPFKTDYGYHIIYLEKIRGQEYDVRHILLMPKVSDDKIKEAKEEIEKIRQTIIDGDISFADAAKEFSNEKETKYQGGQLINPATQDYNFELTKMDPELYGQIQDLDNNEVSQVITDQDRTGAIKFKLVTVTDRIDEHEADYGRDYLKIKDLALNEKRFEAIEKWQDETIKETYIKISEAYRNCDFKSNWLKK
ncbi:peptidylprolyl isomerase [Mesoflavibacter profundi]|uniref:Peptidylprolyl isomerase n=1 Tax=Mesoflavibacter profundi TaxID=2708110 RepID=A0ABT4RWG0_9FLAO|nr:peptidylprolyl isomerase [Mesoflavibacter profundi]MDA0176171.1 peptidylprolyl isomerase [Mesoflavibacter profundi]